MSKPIEGTSQKDALVLGLVLGTVGRSVLKKAFENSVKVIEAQNGAAQARDRGCIVKGLLSRRKEAFRSCLHNVVVVSTLNKSWF